MEESKKIPSKPASDSSFFSPIISIVLLIVVIWLGYKGIIWVQNKVRPKSWTLFLYSSPTPDIYYQTNRIDGYKSQTECIEKGIIFTKEYGSFECGYDCNFKPEYGEVICDRVCSRSGCRD